MRGDHRSGSIRAAVAQPDHRDSRLGVLTLALDAGSGYGGAERLAYEFALRLDPSRFRSFLCTIRAAFPDRREATARDREALAEASVGFVELNQRLPFPATPAAWRELYALMRRESIDVVHAHMPRASVPGAIVARLARVPVVISHEHGSTLEGKTMRRFLDRNVVARMSTVVLAVSEWDRRQLIELQGMPPERIQVFSNGIVTPPEEGPDVRPELGVPEGLPLIGSVGRLYEQKGYEYLVEAVAVLKRRGRRLRCLILGLGPEEQRLRDLIAELDVHEEVQLTGRRADAIDVVRALDVAVLPSRWEGSPLVVMEYMALGAPIVATAVGGVPEMIEDGVHGLLVAPQDPEALAAGIERVLADRALGRRLGAAARSRQRERYDLSVVEHRLEQLYVELFAQASTGGSRRPIKGIA
jgi:glycosyltransferase involved in cell wall biosynthesis